MTGAENHSTAVVRLVLATLVCVLLVAPTASAGLLGQLGRKLDAELPPLERATAMLGDGAEAANRLAIVEGARPGTYKVVGIHGALVQVAGQKDLFEHLNLLFERSAQTLEFVFEQSDFSAFSTRLVETRFVDRALVALDGGDIVPIRRLAVAGGPPLAVEIRPNLLVGAWDLLDHKDIRSVLNVSFDTRDTQVFSLFHETDHRTRAELDASVGEIHTDLFAKTAEEILFRLGEERRQIIVVVGHVEGDHFVVRGADGAVSTRVLIADLEQTAAAGENSLILLGCEAAQSARASSGLVTPVTDIDVARALREAVRADSYGAFLSALASAPSPLLIRSPTLRRQQHALEAARLRSAEEIAEGAVGLATVVVAGTAPQVVAERRNRIIPFLPVWVHVVYGVGAFVAAFIGRTLWREWRGLFPILAGRTAHRVTLLRALRVAGFALIAPTVGMLLIGSLPIAMLLFFIPFVPSSAVTSLLFWVEMAPFRLFRMILRPRPT